MTSQKQNGHHRPANPAIDRPSTTDRLKSSGLRRSILLRRPRATFGHACSVWHVRTKLVFSFLGYASFDFAEGTSRPCGDPQQWIRSVEKNSQRLPCSPPKTKLYSAYQGTQSVLRQMPFPWYAVSWHTRQCRRSSVSGRFDAALGVGPVVLSGTSTTVPDGAAVSTAGVVASTSAGAATGGAGTRLCDRLHGGGSVEPDAPGALPTGAGGGGGNPLAAPGGPPADDPPCKYSQIA